MSARGLVLGLSLFAVAIAAVVAGNAITAGLQLRHLEDQAAGE